MPLRFAPCTVALFICAASASAVTFTQTVTRNAYVNPPGGSFTLTFNGVPTPLAGGTLRVRGKGDLDGSNEYLDVTMEGIQFGLLFNNNPNDDRFNNSGSGDIGLLNSPVSSIANVTLAEFTTVAANGSIVVTITPSGSVADAEFIEATITYDAAGTGACCIASSETCQDLSSSACTTAGGTYAGDGTACASYVCFPKGACCLPNGTCTGDQVTPSACAAQNGVFQGNGSTCATSDCRIKGACCVAGSCSAQTAGDCATAGGAYGGDNTTCTGDADTDGVPDSCDACPNTVPGIGVDAVGCPPLIPGDFDRDGDVDSTDFGAFAACSSRSKVPHPGGCSAKDLDTDGDVDLNDFAKFQRCFSGEGTPGNAACAN